MGESRSLFMHLDLFLLNHLLPTHEELEGSVPSKPATRSISVILLPPRQKDRTAFTFLVLLHAFLVEKQYTWPERKKHDRYACGDTETSSHRCRAIVTVAYNDMTWHGDEKLQHTAFDEPANNSSCPFRRLPDVQKKNYSPQQPETGPPRQDLDLGTNERVVHRIITKYARQQRRRGGEGKNA